MDKYLVEFYSDGFRKGVEIYASSENDVHRLIREQYSHTGSISIKNLSEEERIKEQKILEEEERRQEEEKISRMAPEEKKIYLRQKAINGISGFIAVVSLLGMWYWHDKNQNLMGICFLIAVIALTIRYRKLILGFLRFLIGLFILASLIFGGIYVYGKFFPSKNTSNNEISKIENNVSKPITTEQKVSKDIKNDRNTTNDKLNIKLTEQVSKKQKEDTSQYDKVFATKVEKIIASNWDKTPDTFDGNTAKVIIKISDQGVFSHKIVSLSYNNEFNTKLKQFLKNMEKQEFPKYEKGTFFETQVEFKDVLK